jgi:hypothetical protein
MAGLVPAIHVLNDSVLRMRAEEDLLGGGRLAGGRKTCWGKTWIRGKTWIIGTGR